MIGILTTLMSVALVMPLIASTTPTVTTPSGAALKFPALAVSVGNCYLWGQLVPKRDDYTYTPGIGGHKMHSKTVKWNEARTTCESEGGYLTIINSDAESAAIAGLFVSSPAPPGTSQEKYAHIGFHDLYQNGDYVTIHGESIAKTGFDKWATGEPNNHDGIEHCGSVYMDGKLNDINCTSLARFVCEVPLPLM